MLPKPWTVRVGTSLEYPIGALAESLWSSAATFSKSFLSFTGVPEKTSFLHRCCGRPFGRTSKFFGSYRTCVSQVTLTHDHSLRGFLTSGMGVDVLQMEPFVFLEESWPQISKHSLAKFIPALGQFHTPHESILWTAWSLHPETTMLET
jgi:hypothetical protein